MRGAGRLVLGAAMLAAIVALTLAAIGSALVVYPASKVRRGRLAGAMELATALGDVVAAIASMRGSSSSSSAPAGDAAGAAAAVAAVLERTRS